MTYIHLDGKTPVSNRSAYETRNGKTVCINDEIPFDIPDSWVWARLGMLIRLTSGQDLEPHRYNSSGIGIPYITGASNFQKNELIINRWTESPTSTAHKGEILLTCKGTVGKLLVLNKPLVHIARQIMSLCLCGEMSTRYLENVLLSYSDYLQKVKKGHIPGIDRDTIVNLLIPLPPLAEQKRIVAKIEEVRKLTQVLTT